MSNIADFLVINLIVGVVKMGILLIITTVWNKDFAKLTNVFRLV
jgi:hypothetical protein